MSSTDRTVAAWDEPGHTGHLIPAWVVIVNHQPAGAGGITVLGIVPTEAEAVGMAHTYMLAHPAKEATVHPSGLRAGPGWEGVRGKECGT